jgi:serine/threonine-protein kinase
MLYELLTGRRPFAGNSDVDTLRLICDGRYPPPRSLRREIPRDLEAVCLKCLEHDPHRRYQRADDLAADLRRFVADQPVSVSGVGPVGRLIRWSRRRPLVAALSGTVAASLLFGVCGIWWQGQVAEAHRREAEANFQQAHQAVREFHELLYGDDAYDAPVFQPLRAQVLHKALEYYQAFLDRHAGDPQLTAHVAEAWYQTGFIAQTLDDRDEAVRRYRLALPLWQALTESQPDVREHRYYLAKTCVQLGLLLQQMGERNEAQRLAAAAVTIQDELCRSQPEDRGAQSALADDLYIFGALLKSRGQPAAALDPLRRAERIRETLIRSGDDSAEQCRELARTQNKLGFALLDLGQLDAAEESIRGAVDSLASTNVVQADPEDRLARANSLQLLGQIRMQRHDGAGAALMLREAGTTYAELAEAFPEMRKYREGLAANRRRLAEALIGQEKVAEARSFLEEACGMLDGLQSGAPDPTKAACTLGDAYYQLGSLERDSGAADAALDWYARAEQTYRRVIEQAPDRTSAVHSLSATRYQTALLLTGLGRVEAARAACEDAVQLRRRLAEELEPGNEEHRQLLNRYSGRLASIEKEFAALEGKSR